MTHEIELLTVLVDKFLEATMLRPKERAEIVRIAQGYQLKDSARAAGLSPETVRARRKSIYRKLGVSGTLELSANLLECALAMLARGERIGWEPESTLSPDPTDKLTEDLNGTPGDSRSVEQAATIAG
jgi:DNA-binding CsgD family transcriptional regulator